MVALIAAVTKTINNLSGFKKLKAMASSQRIRGPPSSVSSDDDLIDIQHTGTTNSDIAYGADGEVLENGNNPNKSTGWQFGEEIPGLGQYDDFHTIDWQRDIARDRMRHRYV